MSSNLDFMHIDSDHVLVSVDSRDTSELVITADSQIKGIGPGACKDMQHLKKLFLDVEWIGKGAFAGCTQLEEIELFSGRRLCRIEQGAFSGCPAKFVKFGGSIQNWLDIIRNSGWAKQFDHCVIVQTLEGDLSYDSELDYGK